MSEYEGAILSLHKMLHSCYIRCIFCNLAVFLHFGGHLDIEFFAVVSYVLVDILVCTFLHMFENILMELMVMHI